MKCDVSFQTLIACLLIPILGDPTPELTWWRDSHLIDTSFESTFSGTVQNTLSVPQISREDLGATLSCQASNNNVSTPASSKVTIDLKCKKHLPQAYSDKRLQILWNKTASDQWSPVNNGDKFAVWRVVVVHRFDCDNVHFHSIISVNKQNRFHYLKK